MIALYKRQKDKIETIGLKENMKKHDKFADNCSSLMIIQEIMILKCLYYYEFEEIKGTSENICLPYIRKSRYLDYVILDEPSKNIDM